MANPRKFSEKIALQKQKQAEGTAEFEKIMKEVYATKMDETQANQKIMECCLTSGTDVVGAAAAAAAGNGGAERVGNGGGGGGSGASGGGASPEDTAGGGSGSPTAYRESRGRSMGVGPMRRPSERKQDRSPYGSSSGSAAANAAACMGMVNNGLNTAYLSPPMDSSWRRSNSDSALHQTLVSAEGGFGPGGIGAMAGDMAALQSSYQNHNQRSHSPNIGRSFSPQAQRRKASMNHHQQQQQHHHQQQQQQQHMHLQQQQQHMQQQHMAQQQHQQQQQHFNAKFQNCNVPANSLFKSLQDQAMTFANTGSLPDLTSVRYATPTQQQLMHHQQQTQQQQQQTLSPILSPHNNGRDRVESPSPFSPPGGGPPSPYHQQQHSPTSAANTPTAAQTSPHLSFTNLAVQSPTAAQNPAQAGSFGTLPTLGAASSTGNLTDYRQPLNPPSPGSSPGLLTSVSGHELHTSAPASPIRHPQTTLQQTLQGYSDKNMQTFERYSPAAMGASNVDAAGYNSLNPSFHNHFEQFSLGDSNSSPEQQQQLQQQFQQQQQNTFAAIDFEDFVNSSNSQQQAYSQNMAQNKILDYNDLAAAGRGSAGGGNGANVSNGGNTAATTCSNNNNLRQQSGRTLVQQQLLNNNSSTNMNGPSHAANNNASMSSQQSDTSGALRQDVLSSPIPSPSGCVPSPSSPLPIPQSPHHQHQLSLSLHSQHSPHHSPLHSPHHSSPISMSSPGGVSALGGPSPVSAGVVSGNAVSSSTNASNMGSTAHNHHHHQQQHQHQQQLQHHHQQQQQHQHQQHLLQQANNAHTPTATNIPSIIFSDYSSNSEFFDTLDLDLGQMDVAGLQMLSDQNAIMIADPTIEDSFRRDLN